MIKIPTKQFIESDCGFSIPDFLKLSQRAPTLYHRKSFPKPNGTHRIISAPAKELMLVQKKLAERLKKIPILPEIYGTPGTSHMDAMKPHRGKPLLIALDISNFFPTIKKYIINKVFKEILDDDSLADNFARLCTSRGELPQGAPTSPALARIVIQPTIIDLCRCIKKLDPNSVLTVWVDDITISGAEGLKRSIKTLLKILKRHGFPVNQKKIRIFEKESIKSNLGLIVGNKLAPDKDVLERYTKSLHEKPININRVQGFEQYFKNIKKSNIE